MFLAFPMSLLRRVRGISHLRLLSPVLSSLQGYVSTSSPNPHPHPFSPPILLPLSPCPLSLRAAGISFQSFCCYSRSSDVSFGAGAGEGYSTESNINLDPVLSAQVGTEVFSATEGMHDAVGEAVGGNDGVDGVPNFAIGAVVELLDRFHDLSGLSWWIIISLSTLAVRLSLLPVLILQLKKTARIAELLPKLPPPLPPHLSGRNFYDQYSLFKTKKQELGCPSFFWNFAYFVVQFPCFILWMASIQSMCSSNHPGFSNGGALWFHNLTDYPHGAFGPIFPILLASLHYWNVQISFETVKVKHYPGILGSMVKHYKLYLDILAIPLFLTGYVVSQGSLVYWTTNGLFTLVQQLSLRNDLVRNLWGLPDIKAHMVKKVPLGGHSVEGETSEKLSFGNAHVPTKLGFSDSETGICNTTPRISLEGSSIMEVSAVSLTPRELLEKALQEMGSGNQDQALSLIRKTIEENPDLWIPLIGMAQTLFSNKLFPEAAECFEHAMLKIGEQEPLLVLAYYGAGISRIMEGNKKEGIKHLKRLAGLKEPDKPINKACYYRGLVLLAWTLFEEGQKYEAAKYLRLAASYDPSVDRYLKECEHAIEEDEQKSRIG